MWDEVRQQLGGDFLYGPGHWFCVPHADVYRPDGRPFSRKDGGSGRRVVLATQHGPNATLFARSASIPSPFQHLAHVHPDGAGSCQLDRDGWIDFRLPLGVSSAALSDTNYSCEEPAHSAVYVELEKAVSP